MKNTLPFRIIFTWFNLTMLFILKIYIFSPKIWLLVLLYNVRPNDIWWVFIYLVGIYLLLLFLFISICYFYFSFLKLPSDIYRLNQITVWNILKSSKNQSLRELFEITGMKNIRNDSIVKRSANAKIAKSLLTTKFRTK